MQESQHGSYSSYIGGRWIATDTTFPIVDPATAQTIDVSTIARADVRTALGNAEDALPLWRSMTARDRGALLHRVADELVRRKSEIARIITCENGKPLA
jgi:succinate-semialdehyde dehydrogenase / glutarate-semialdehyde dehydrogenase